MAKKAKKARKSWTIRLDGEAGAVLQVVTKLRGEGAVSYAVHVTKEGRKKLHTRGATEQHASIEAARVAADKVVAQAAKLGWKVREARTGFKAKADAFSSSNLPSPSPRR